MSEVELFAGWKLSETGLQLNDPDITFEHFEIICSMLGSLHGAVRFAIGDAIIQGELLFGERSYQAFLSFQLSEDAMKEYVRVAQRVPRAQRVKGLSWSHHRAVAPLEPVAQREWLSRATDEAMSHADLRAALRNGAAPEPKEACPTCGRTL